MGKTALAAWVAGTQALLVAAMLGFAGVPALAATVSYSLALDSDASSATGCTFPTANGTFPGVDLVYSTVITTRVGGASVTRLERRTCVGTTLGAPVVYDSGGWPVGFGNGTGGNAVVEAAIPLNILAPNLPMRAIVVSDDGAGGSDATSPFTLTIAAAPGAQGIVPVPISPWLLPPLALAVLGLTAWLRRRYPGQFSLVVVVVVFGVSGLVWAATAILDGNAGDWAGVPPAVSDGIGDAPANADVVAFFHQQDNQRLYVRYDADVRRETASNQAPVVNAGSAQVVTLPSPASLNATASDDGLPNPPGVMSLAWSRLSGPGTVTFSNPSSVSTQASFSAAGSYVLRLTAFDGALSGTSDVAVVVQPGGGGGPNQAPVVTVPANQAIVLPAMATLAGAASDDGLPNPPGALSVAWALESGPSTGVAFGDPALASTNGRFFAPGVYVLRLTASDGALSASATTQVTVTDGAPLIAPVADRTVRVGEAVQVLLQASDGNGSDVLSYALPVAPAGAVLSHAPMIDWRPTAAQIGVHAFTASVTDGAGHVASVSFNVTVVSGNAGPQLGPQADLTMAVGGAFTRPLSATDPNPGDTLSFTLVSGPPGMTLVGRELRWATGPRAPGSYDVTVRVSDAAGATDTKTFTITLTASAAAVPVADTYAVQVGRTLTVPASGVLANDLNPSGVPVTAVKRSDPAVGTLSAFNADGSFTYEAPAAFVRPPLGGAEGWRGTPAGQVSFSFPVVGDVNGDGAPDLVLSSQFIGHRAVDGRTGATLWNIDTTGYGDCRFDFPSTTAYALADIDDDGKLEYVGNLAPCERDSRVNAAGYAPSDRIFALDASTGRVKWFSERISRPLADMLAPGTPPSTEERFKHVYDGAAYASMHVARLTPNGAPTVMFRKTITNGEGFYTPVTGPNRSAGCRGLTGLVADDARACRAVILMSGADGSVQHILTSPNADNTYEVTRDPWRAIAPFTVDVDGDGTVEIVAGSDVWKNANGTWTLLWQSPREPIQALAADLDGDGRVEIVHFHAFSKSGGGTGIDEGFNGLIVRDGATGAEKRRIRMPVYWTAFMTIADVDGDNAPDFVISTDGSVLAIGAEGGIKWRYALTPGSRGQVAGSLSGSSNVQVYDLDGDGINEVVTEGTAGVEILDGRTGRQKGFFASEGMYGGYTHPNNIQIVDADNDGHADILAMNVNAPAGQDYVLYKGPSTWLAGPKAHHQANFMIGDVSDAGRVLFNNAVPRSFRNPQQRGTVGDPRRTEGAVFSYALNQAGAESAMAEVLVKIQPQNRPPVITSTPPSGLLQRFAPNPPGGLFTHYYQATGFDPDAGDTIRWSVPDAPSHVTIDAATGRVRFEPTCGSWGNPCPWGWTFVLVRATDSVGAYAEQMFAVNLTVTPASVPNVIGQMLDAASATIQAAALTPFVQNEVHDSAPAGRVLAQDPIAGTPDVGAGANVNLTVSKGPAPVAMPFLVGKKLAEADNILRSAGLSNVSVGSTFSATVPATEVITQSPAFGTLVSAADPVTLSVSAGAPLAAAVARIVVEPGTTSRIVGDDLLYRATAILADGTSADVTVTAAWTSSAPTVASIDSAGSARALAAGPTTISARLSGISGAAQLNVSARALADNTPPAVSIATPADGGEVSAPITITGTASDVNFLRYELALAPAGQDTFTVIGEGTSAVTGGALGTLDPTTLVNDQYTLRLRAWDRAENEAEATISVQVGGYRKAGLFTVAYQDLLVPAVGIPVAVNRVYDSRDKAQGDFGVGWRMSYNTLRLRANRVPGTGWVRQVSGPSVTLVPTSPHKVSITLADGRVEEFDMVVSPTTNIGSLDFTRITGYAPRAGTLGTLAALGNLDVLIVNDGFEDQLVDDTTLDAFDPKLYRYTAQDGTVYEIHKSEGVKKVTDRLGNSVTFGPDGIIHSNGASVVFTRDLKGRIVEIRDPMGHSQTYAYDGNGDLVTHTNAVGGISRYRYDRLHGLIHIVDAAGVNVTRNEYDDTGRLVAIVDAEGRRTTFTHNEAANEEIVTDRLGRVSKLSYDAIGNVTRQERVVTIEGTPMNVVTTASFDALGNRTQAVDGDGMRTTATFHGTLPLGKVVDAGGLALTTGYGYDGTNRITGITDASGRQATIAYEAGGGVASVTLPGRGTVAFTNNTKGQPVERRDAQGNRLVLTRDAAGNVVREERYDAASTLLQRKDSTWDANGNKTSETLYRTVNGSSVPLTARYAYDAMNQLVAETDALGGTTRYEYDASGRLTATVDALGRRTATAYDSVGRRSRVDHPDGTFETFAYDAEGNETASTDRAGRTTTHAYDELNRRVRTTAPDGSSTRVVYSPGGRVAATIDARGNRTDYTYDSAGRTIGNTLPAVTPPGGGAPVRPVMTRSVDALGQVVGITDPNGRATSYQFDDGGFLTRLTNPDGTFTQYAYDALGRRTSVTNEEGQVTTYAWDALDRLVSVGGLVGDYTYAYDEAGNRIRQTDALGRITRFRYDELDRLVERIYPGGESERFGYDAVGNRSSRTDAAGRITTFSHDAMNRPVRKSLPGGLSVEYAYAPDGQRAAVADARGSTTYAYDSAGRLSTVTHPGGAVVRYGYDAAGKLASIATPAAAVTYAWDALDRLLQVTAPEGTTSYAWDLAGNRVRESHPNGVVTATTYDVRDRPTMITHRGPGGTTLQSHAMAYSPSGRRLSMTEADGAVETWAYDAKGRLVSESRTGATPYAITHTYDAVGNRVQTVRGGVATSFSYDSNDRMTVAGAASLAWDANGNLASRTAGGSTLQYGYDPEQRLVSILGAGTPVQYQYDDDGQRVRSTTPAGTRRFLADAANATGLSQVLEERDGTGGLAARYTYGIDQVSQVRGGAVSVAMRDGLGSVRALANGSGAITDQYAFDAYGTTISKAGSSPNPYLYRGERQDEETGFYQLRARYYDPAPGRFITRDPLPGRAEDPLTLHRYGYAANDPINFIDPTGQEFQLPSLLTSLFIIGLGADVVSFGATIAGAQDVAMIAGAVSLATAVISLPISAGWTLFKTAAKEGGEAIGKEVAKKQIRDGVAKAAVAKMEQRAAAQVAGNAKIALEALKGTAREMVEQVMGQFGRETAEVLQLAAVRQARQLGTALPQMVGPMRDTLKLLLKEAAFSPKEQLVVRAMIAELDRIISFAVRGL